MSFLKKVFSITDTTYRTEYRILGIKIAIAKPEYQKKRKENPYYYYKKNNVDITTIPPATGQLRDIQLANLALLKELDYVCKQNGLKYWLDFVTLLGAVRHKGFIPWDDDIDTGMLREDYEKVIDAFNKSSRNPDIYAGYTRTNDTQYHIKVKHRKCPHLFVDIFPYDYYGKELGVEEQLKETKRIKDIRKTINNTINEKNSNKELIDLIIKSKKDVVKTEINSDNKNFDLVWGIEFNHLWKNWFTPYRMTEPLQEIEFEGYKFPCLNEPEYIMTKVYGDYMSYPKKINFAHNAYLEMTAEDKQVVEDLKNSLER
ncbi:LicD family protein [bacterium]|nr:LicD family protein [bacterium]